MEPNTRVNIEFIDSLFDLKYKSDYLILVEPGFLYRSSS